MSGLDKLTVLLNEDLRQVRSLLVWLLTQIGVGQVLRAPEGADAMRSIWQTQRDSTSSVASSTYMVITNWVKNPIDGAYLPQWVCRHKDTPDHFIPFAMVNAYSESHWVQTARNLGVNKFLSKLFYVAFALEYIIAVIQDHRQSIRTNSFFGRDRQRKSDPVGLDRRTVHTTNEDAMDKGIRFYSPPRFLRAQTRGDISFGTSQIASVQKELDT